MNKKDTLIFVNGKLLQDNEYVYLLYDSIIFKVPLNSSVHTTFANIVVVEKGVKIYELRITEQNIDIVNLPEERFKNE